MLCWQHIPTMESGLYFISTSAHERLPECNAGRCYSKQIQPERVYCIFNRATIEEMYEPSLCCQGAHAWGGVLGRMTTSQVSVYWLFWGIFLSGTCTPFLCLPISSRALCVHVLTCREQRMSRLLSAPSVPTCIRLPGHQGALCPWPEPLHSLFSNCPSHTQPPTSSSSRCLLCILQAEAPSSAAQSTGTPKLQKGHYGTQLPDPTSPWQGTAPGPQGTTHPHCSSQTVTSQSPHPCSKTLDSESTMNYRPSLWANCKANSEQNHVYLQSPWVEQSPKIPQCKNLCTFIF